MRSFLRPVNPKSPETPELTAAGVADGRRWLLLMEPAEISGRAEIIDGGARYALLRWERLESHIEGVLCREAGDA
ncbi:MAG: hypothetical protein LUF68_06525 [Clostridiales bacterium]|nr:hypothetical protein [Clostridiales bacterium]